MNGPSAPLWAVIAAAASSAKTVSMYGQSWPGGKAGQSASVEPHCAQTPTPELLSTLLLSQRIEQTDTHVGPSGEGGGGTCGTHHSDAQLPAGPVLPGAAVWAAAYNCSSKGTLRVLGRARSGAVRPAYAGSPALLPAAEPPDGLHAQRRIMQL